MKSNDKEGGDMMDGSPIEAGIEQALMSLERKGLVERTGEIRDGREEWRLTRFAQDLSEFNPQLEALICRDGPFLN